MSIHRHSTEDVTHLDRVPSGVCAGKDHAVNEVETFRNTRFDVPASFTSALASFSGNVDCKRCQRWLRASRSQRAKMRAWAVVA